MIKALKGKLTFLLAVLFATIVGSVGTAVVMAAIPGSDGTISGCYGKLAGNVRIIDTEAGKTCTNLENPISWSANGGGSGTGNAQIAHAAFNPDGTLDTTYSENIVEAKIVEGGGDPATGPDPVFVGTACFMVEFTPRVATARFGGGDVYVPSDSNVSGGADIVAFIEEWCGEGFNPAFTWTATEPAISSFKFNFLR